MIIGLTYDLRPDYLALGYSEEEIAELDEPRTIEALEETIQSLGHKTQRIGNIHALLKALQNGQRWDLVFNICEGLHGRFREAQVPVLLELYQIPFTFSDAFVLTVCLDKSLTKLVVSQAGLATPEFKVIKNQAELNKLDLPFPLFAKPVAEGAGKGITASSIIYNQAELEKRVSLLLNKFKQPVLVERYLTGREFTVGIIGTGQKAHILGTLEIKLLPTAEEGVYSYLNKAKHKSLVEYILAEDEKALASAELALKAWKVLDCRDGGRVDIRLDENGIPHFLEVNPLAGLHPEHSDLPILCQKKGISYKNLIAQILQSACERIVS